MMPTTIVTNRKKRSSIETTYCSSLVSSLSDDDDNDNDNDNDVYNVGINKLHVRSNININNNEKTIVNWKLNQLLKRRTSFEKDDATTESTSSVTASITDDEVSNEIDIHNHHHVVHYDDNDNDSMTQYWNVFDHMICLNLKTRKDRFIHSINEFTKIGIIDRIEFQINERSPISGLYGCFESHINAVKSAYDKGYNNILIFEDDCSFLNGWEIIIKDSANFIRNAPNSNDSWEYLNLNGCIIYGVEDCIWNTNILNGKATMAHIYCLSRLGMKNILDKYYNNINKDYCIDIAYSFDLRKSFVHKKHSTIVQLMDTLGTDHAWASINNFSLSLSPQMKQFIQTNVLPNNQYVWSSLILLMTKYIPYQYRPWLCHSTLFSFKSMEHCYVLISRHENNKNGHIQQIEDSFRWNDSTCSSIFKIFLGAVAYIVFIMSPSRNFPPGINRWNLFLAMLTVNKK